VLSPTMVGVTARDTRFGMPSFILLSRSGAKAVR
jgi:hypothetical protein